MYWKIYQVDTDKDTDRVKFLGYEELLSLGKRVNPDLYKCVFVGDLPETDLEDMFRRFNTVGHPEYIGHSMSVSDVLVNEHGAYYCDSIGFTEIGFKR